VNIIFKSLFVFMLAVYGGSIFSAELLLTENPSSAAPYTSRVLGERALRHKLYDRAESFFRRYKTEAKDDKKALKDAGECLISTLIRQSRADAAQAELDALKKLFPDTDRLRRALYQAEIYLLKSEPAKAEDTLEKVLSPKQPVIGGLYFQMLSCQGFAQAKQKKWPAAAETFGLLRRASVGTTWEKKAYIQELNNAIRGRDYKLASKLLDDSRKYRNDDNYLAIQKLRLCLLLEEKKLSEFKKAYIATTFPDTADASLYNLDLTAAKSFIAAEKFKDAIYFMRRAIKYAPTPAARQNALLRLAELYESSGDKKAAAQAALDYAAFYPDAENASTMRLKAADLLANTGDIDAAINICEKLTLDANVKPEQQAAAAIAAAEFAVSRKKWDVAEKYCRFVDSLKCVPAIIGQGLFFIGEVRLKRRLYRSAADVFLELANKNPNWEARARYEAARALELAGEPVKVLAEVKKLLVMKNLPPELIVGVLYLQAAALDRLDRDKEAVGVFTAISKKYPKHKLADDALFKAGQLAFALGDYDLAGQCFEAFANDGLHAKSEFTPNALYKGIYADIFRQAIPAAAKKLAILRKQYSGSEYTAAAMFRQADEYFAAGRYELSLPILTDMEAMFKDNKKIIPRILAAKMAAHAELGHSIDALKLLAHTQKSYPGYSGLSEMYFLAGDLASRAGDYDQAQKYFQAIPPLRPGSLIAAAAFGRVGDCLFARFSKTFKPELRDAAIKQYKEVLKIKKIPALIQVQAAYKLGRCYESMKDQRKKALEYYSDAVFSGVPDAGAVSEPEKIWMVKAAYASARIYSRTRGKGKSAEKDVASAIGLYQLLRKLRLKTGEDFDALIDDLKRKYRRD
jgi:TolA-binding protein